MIDFGAEVVASTPKYPVPAVFPNNGYAPTGCRSVIAYQLTNGHAK
jgi:hypothetical protein